MPGTYRFLRCGGTNFESCMRSKYKKIKVSKGNILNYIGMMFDFIVPGQVSITMENCERSFLSEGRCCR